MAATSQRILVAGGAGFIGSHLVERLLERGHQVISVDNYFTGNRHNLDHLRHHRDLEIVRHDVCQPYLAEVDMIFNLACPASPIHYQYNPIKTIKTNVLGTLNLLGLAKRVKARFVQASSSEVYGVAQVHPQPEDYWGSVNPIGLRSCYDEGKRVAETLCFDYHRQNGVDIRIARIFNTYGPRMSIKDGRVVSNFICQALRGEDVTVYGDGKQTRSFCYIDDLVEAFIRLAFHPSQTGPLNLGNTEEITVRDLAQKIIKLTNSNARITLGPLPSDDPKTRMPVVDKALQELRWQAETPIDLGLSKTIPYFREQLKLN